MCDQPRQKTAAVPGVKTEIPAKTETPEFGFSGSLAGNCCYAVRSREGKCRVSIVASTKTRGFEEHLAVHTHRVLSVLLVGLAAVIGFTGMAFAQTAAAGSPADENKAWTRVNALDATSLEAFLKAFPNGRHAPEATRAISLHKDFDTASASNTIPAYRSFLVLFKSDPGEKLSSIPLAPSSKLYWSAREKVEKLIISQINKNGVGQRFRIKGFQPQEDSYTGSITVMEGQSSEVARNSVES